MPVDIDAISLGENNFHLAPNKALLDTGPQHILLFDDSEVERLYLEAVLSADYKVTVAANLIDFWANLSEDPPDLILMDVTLKEMSGFDLTKQLKLLPEYQLIPVIFVTSLDSAADIEEGFACGGHDFVSKPIRQRELKARIRSAVRISRLESELRLRSITDYLTGIYNRRFFFETIHTNLNYAQRMRRSFSLAILDIDFFKKINDKYGHETGDAVLKHFAQMVKSQIRRYDVVARLGGEEFIIQFLDSDPAACIVRLNRIRDNIAAAPCQFNGETIAYTYSGGVAGLTEVSMSRPIDEMVELADKRLYAAKAAGRDRFIASGVTL